MSKLTSDCLYEIFQYLEDNTKTLHSCLLVNRIWCETSVPLLWRDPFKQNIFKEKYYIGIFCTLFSCLDEETKQFLSLCNINSTDLTQKRIIFNKPLFKYPIYCRYLNLNNLNEIISHTKQQFNNGNEDFVTLVKQVFLKMLISKSSSIKRIIIQDDDQHQIYPISNFLGAEKSLSQLVELQCDSDINSLFYYELARCCKNIQRLKIPYCRSDNSGLISLIKVQRSLKYLYCEACDKPGGCHEIGKALSEYQSKSLIELELIENICISIKFISSFINLKKLKIDIYGDSLNSSEICYLERTKLLKLEYLSTDIELPRLSIITRLISNTIGNLCHIYLGSFVPDETYQDIESYHKAISKHCPNINYVSTFIYEDNEISNNRKNSFGLEELIKSCNKLKGIIFYGIRMESEGFDLFNMIKRFASNTLCDIKIVGNCELQSFYFEWFLENWRSRDPLSLSISESVYEMSEDLDNVKDKFLKKGVLKNFKILETVEDFEIN
ncbi:hypothetical protein RhiirA4_453819 [Rhizophagus irregularis]|uniref:F-box domain-containing protein n=1 Tax=Rhizophagus irregularis TaxID=588596 RepID=A0A2I1G1G9_9GLOM|nr:hypothetical protein RhiirA4_453819 [Rhizophagus irregularis]